MKSERSTKSAESILPGNNSTFSQLINQKVFSNGVVNEVDIVRTHRDLTMKPES